MTENESTSANGIPDINEHVMQNGHVNPLRILCAQLHEQIEAFLQEDIQEERLKAVQAQCRHSLDIIQEALDRYPYVPVQHASDLHQAFLESSSLTSLQR